MADLEEKIEEIKEVAAEEVAEVKEEVAEEKQTMADLGEELEKSLKQGPPKADDPKWDKFEELLKSKEVFTVKIEEIVKAGAVAYVDEVRAFIPASKLAAGFVEKLDEFKDKKIEVIVITADRENKKLVLSGREAARAKARDEKKALREQAIAAINVDDVLEGTIDTLTDYGAFVNLDGGATGLLHVTQISYKRVEKPEDVLKKGQRVTVKVTKNENGKLSLSMKALLEPPKRAPRPEDGEKRERRGRDKEEHVEYTEKGGATTSLADKLAGIKL